MKEREGRVGEGVLGKRKWLYDALRCILDK